MMSSDKKFLLCQQCLFQRLLNFQHPLCLNACNWGIWFFQRFFLLYPKLFNRCFRIAFRNIRSPRFTLQNFNCSTGFSSKYFDDIEIVGIWRSFEFRYNLFALFNCFFTVVIIPWITFSWNLSKFEESIL